MDVTPPIRGPRGKKPSAWKKERAQILAKASKLEIKIRLPESEPKSLKSLNIIPKVSPDGRTDVDTVAEMRMKKVY